MLTRCTATVLPLALAILCGCGAGGAGRSSSPLPTPTPATAPTPAAPPRGPKIRHVVILVQENRTLDNLFNGYPGADTVQSATLPGGATIPLSKIELEAGIDLDHYHTGFEADFDGGKNDGFGHPPTQGSSNAPPDYAYSYVDPAETAIYRTLAARNVLADRMFQSNSGPSFSAHEYLIAGQSANIAEIPTALPWGCDAPPGTTAAILDAGGTERTGPYPCLDYTTLGDLLDGAGQSWAYYTPQLSGNLAGEIWNAYDAVKHIRYGPDWTSRVRSPETTVFDDIAAGTLPSVAWVAPSVSHSDHPMSASASGPQWVGSVVDAIGTSPYWNDTAILVVWDDWGGFYDHVVPQQLDVMGLGYRVPLLVISPYAKSGYVSHVQHEFGSLLRFTEATFGLPSLGTADARADDLSDCFDFSRAPAPYVPVTPPTVRRTMRVPVRSSFVDY